MILRMKKAKAKIPMARTPREIPMICTCNMITCSSGLHKFFLSDFGCATHVGLQNFRNSNAAVFALIIFKHRNQCAADSKATAVHRVKKLWLAAASGAKANIRTTSLKIFKDRTRADLAISSRTWQPNLEVITFCRSKANVARAKKHSA